MNNHHPALSIVCTARNDNHGGDLLERLSFFVEGLCWQCERWRLHGELILVEWNPPEDRVPLVQAVKWPKEKGGLTVRVITVPRTSHARIQHADKLPLFQMIAKNVGIRRAAGRFVLATNIDVLFTDALARRIFGGKFHPMRMYRVDRYDCKTEGLGVVSVSERLALCRDNIIRMNKRNGTLDLRSGQYHVIYPPRRLHGWVHEICQYFGWHEVTSRYRLHTNACGDFTLMARAQWCRLRGYAEFPFYSMHLDSLLCHAAHNGGIREIVLKKPCYIYHLEHAQGSGWTPEGSKILDQRLERAGIPQFSHDDFQKEVIGMRRKRIGTVYNNEDWGLAKDAFKEDCF